MYKRQAYNSGAGAVLRVFDEDKDEAIYKINQMYPEQVYRILTTAHPVSYTHLILSIRENNRNNITHDKRWNHHDKDDPTRFFCPKYTYC